LSNKNSIVPHALTAIAAGLIFMKASGLIDLSWLFVTMPLWILTAISALLNAIVFVAKKIKNG